MGIDMKTVHRFLCGVAVLCPIWSAQHAAAQTGAVERDARLGAPAPVPAASVARPIGAAEEPVAAGEQAHRCVGDGCVEVRAFRFEGNRLYTTAALDAVVARAGGPGAYDLDGLRRVAAAVTQFYRRHGYLVATAWIPPQQEAGGTITIRIAEGRFAAPKAALPAPDAVDATLARAVAAGVNQQLCADAICHDVAVRQGGLEHALLTAGDALGKVVTARLAPGTEDGTSILYVNATARDEPVLTVGADNYGSEAVGRYQFAASVALPNMLTAGDRLTAQVMTTDKADVASGGAQYSVPLAFTGARLSFGGFYTDYTLTGVFAPLGAHGRSYGGTAALAWTVIRRPDSALTFSTGLEVARLNDVLLGYANGRDHWSGRVGIQGQFADAWLGTAAQSQMQLNVVRSSLDFDDPLFDRGGTGGVATKLVGRLYRVQALAGGFTWSVMATGQIASRNLDPYDKLTISGPNGVRAYPIGEYGGDNAFVSQFALGWRRPVGPLGTLAVEGFYDVGRARLQVDPRVVRGNEVKLNGAGAQISLARPSGWALSLFWARALTTAASQVDGQRDRVGGSINFAF